MATILQMLALSPTMETGAINKWHFEEGAKVEQGDVLCEVETDKAAMDYECAADGVLLKILVAAGGEAKVGEPIAIVGKEGEDLAPLLEQAKKLAAEAAPIAAAKQPSETETPSPGRDAAEAAPSTSSTVSTPSAARPAAVAEGADRMRVSPYAARLAAERGVDLARVKGSGPGGRIVARDIEQPAQAALAPSAPSISSIPSSRPAAAMPEGGRDVALTKNRAIMAARLTQSKQDAPHFYITNRIAMDALLDGRDRINKQLVASQSSSSSSSSSSSFSSSAPSSAAPTKLGVNEFLIKACALALAKNPRVNSSFLGDRIVEHAAINIGLAVALEESDGLITPVIQSADRKSLLAIAAELADLVPRARAGRLKPEEYQSGTFTISNLGMYGVDAFTAIINPPQSAILAVGAAKPAAVAGEDGQVAVRRIMEATLSCDHRSVDGVAGARFMRDLQGLLENPLSMLL